MAQQLMYAAQVNSPTTTLSADINATQDFLPITDPSVLLANGVVTIGIGSDAETVLYTNRTFIPNQLVGVTRGFQGTAKSWTAGTPIARLFTAYDHDTFASNIADHESRLVIIEPLADITRIEQWSKTEAPSTNTARLKNVAGKRYDSTNTATSIRLNGSAWFNGTHHIAIHVTGFVEDAINGGPGPIDIWAYAKATWNRTMFSLSNGRYVNASPIRPSAVRFSTVGAATLLFELQGSSPWTNTTIWIDEILVTTANTWISGIPLFSWDGSSGYTAPNENYALDMTTIRQIGSNLFFRNNGGVLEWSSDNSNWVVV